MRKGLNKSKLVFEPYKYINILLKMPEKETFIELYQQYKNACCECEYETALEIYAKMLQQLEEGHEWLCNAYLGCLLSASRED